MNYAGFNDILSMDYRLPPSGLLGTKEMSLNYKFLLSSCLSIVALAVFTPGTVQAGFEWTPPTEPQPMATKAAKAPNHVSRILPGLDVIKSDTLGHANNAEEIEVKMMGDSMDADKSASLSINPYPLGQDGNGGSEMTPVVLSDEELELTELSVEDVNTVPTEMETTKEPMMEGSESYDIIEGFGSEMPLALALRQIVPPSYAFSFGKNVNAGMSVSWNGGEPWNIVLQNALDPLGIKAEIRNKKVILNMAHTQQAKHMNNSMGAPEAEMPGMIPMEDTSPMKPLAMPEQQHDQEDDIGQGLEETPFRRQTILDPGKVEATQPNAIGKPIAAAENLKKKVR